MRHRVLVQFVFVVCTQGELRSSRSSQGGSTRGKVCVDMGLKNRVDCKTVLRCVRNVPFDVAHRVDDSGLPSGRDNIRVLR